MKEILPSLPLAIGCFLFLFSRRRVGISQIQVSVVTQLSWQNCLQFGKVQWKCLFWIFIVPDLWAFSKAWPAVATASTIDKIPLQKAAGVRGSQVHNVLLCSLQTGKRIFCFCPLRFPKAMEQAYLHVVVCLCTAFKCTQSCTDTLTHMLILTA